MSRVINPDSVGKDRKRLVRGVAIALRELARQTEQTGLTRDLLAFIGLSLQVIGDGIEQTVAPWEKRDYWVKADKFRLEWEWTGHVGKELMAALHADDWAQAAKFINCA